MRDRSAELTADTVNPIDSARAIFYFVRDGIKYKIFTDELPPEIFKASETLKRGYGFCIPKAVLMVALNRAAEIPARLHFADIINHQLPPHILDRLRTNLMVFHGYVDLYLNSRWVSLNPALDIELCNKYGIHQVEFASDEDALFHHLAKNGRLHIKYIEDHGTYDDLPYDEIISAFKSTYPGIR